MRNAGDLLGEFAHVQTVGEFIDGKRLAPFPSGPSFKFRIQLTCRSNGENNRRPVQADRMHSLFSNIWNDHFGVLLIHIIG